MINIDPITLEVSKHRLSSIAEEMGETLRKVSFSPNIKERRDFSCAVFDMHGQMISQAAHIPVHLGSMPASVMAAIKHFSSTSPLEPGDAVLLNHPFLGGTHLPDITLVSPLFVDGYAHPFAFVANRAHHADIGGSTPGSMAIASELIQEGLIIPPVKILRNGELQQDILDLILANTRTPQERFGDLSAQLAANRLGLMRLAETIQSMTPQRFLAVSSALLDYSERMTRHLLDQIPPGEYAFADVLDSNGQDDIPVPITVRIFRTPDGITVDFSGSAPQQQTGINAVRAITESAVAYVIRTLIGLDIPNNAGCFRPIKIITDPGSIVDAQPPAAVVAGNVETSQRIVDVVFGAMARALPAYVPAASQGTMNNLLVGGRTQDDRPFTYYETIAGGHGAHPAADGLSATHSHMTNTLNTPIEAFEYAYPLRVERLAIRKGSGGAGFHRGGEGLIRTIRALVPCRATILSERRTHPPYGLSGGRPGAQGKNLLIREDKQIELPAKISLSLSIGDVLEIHTPGGGGWGEATEDQTGSVDAV